MKKFFSILAICVLALAGSLMLTACGEEPRLYLTLVNQPENIIFDMRADGVGNWDDKGQYFSKNDECEIIIMPESTDYEIVDGFKIFINNQEVSLSKELLNFQYDEQQFAYGYKGTYTVKSDMTVTFEGSVKEREVNVTLKVDSNIEETTYQNDNVYIEFTEPQLFNLSKNKYTLRELKTYLDENPTKTKLSVLTDIEIYTYSTASDIIEQMFTNVIDGENWQLDGYVYLNSYYAGIEYNFNCKNDVEIVLSPAFAETMHISLFGMDENMDMVGEIAPSNSLINATLDEDKITLTLLKYSDINYKSYYDTMKLKLIDKTLTIGEDYQISNEGKIVLSVDQPYCYKTGDKISQRYLNTYEISTDIIEKLVNDGKTFEINLYDIELKHNGLPLEGYLSFQFYYDSGYLYHASNIATYLNDSKAKLEIYYLNETPTDFTTVNITYSNGTEQQLQVIKDGIPTDDNINVYRTDEGLLHGYIFEITGNLGIQTIEFV